MSRHTKMNINIGSGAESNRASVYLPVPPPMSPLGTEFGLDQETNTSSRPNGTPARSSSTVSMNTMNDTNNDMFRRPSLNHSNSTSAVLAGSRSESRIPTVSQQTAASAPIAPTTTSVSVESWRMPDIRAWLDKLRCSAYVSLFEEHHITGDVLLDCDDNALRDIGVVKVGDRIRISLGIKKLKEQSKPAASIQYSSAPTTGAPSVVTVAPYPRSLEQLNEKVMSPFDHTPLAATPLTNLNSSSSQGLRKKFHTPPLSNKTAVGPTQTVTVNNDHGEVNVLSMDIVKQNNVKFIYSEGESRTVNVSGCQTAADIKDRALKKMGIEHSNRPNNNWGVFVTDSESGATARKLQDFELVAICRSADHSERKRLIICSSGTSPTSKQLSKSQKILRDSLELSSDYRSSRDSFSASEAGTLKHGYSGYSHTNGHKGSEDYDRYDDSGAHNTITSNKLYDRGAIGLQRPPSELISSNLEEYFPDTNKQQLKETVQASRRFSKRVSRLSRYSNRMSIASLGILEADESVSIPPVPPLPDNQGSSSYTKNRQSVISTTGSTRNSDIARHSNMISAIARRLSTVSLTKSQRRPFSESTEFPSKEEDVKRDSVHQKEEEEGEEEEEDDIKDIDDNENIDELIDVIRREETGPTRWIKGNFIGSGSFGQVHLGMNAITGELMAVKQVELPNTSDNGDESRKTVMIDALNHEMSLLRVLHHPNIVQYFGSNTDENFINIFLEYVPGGSVATMLANYGAFESSLVRNFVRQILDGLDYLHKQKIIHRDIKGANILVDNRGNVKISDFGISKKIEAEFMTSNRGSMQGSVFWMAPEVVKQTSYTSKADIWSLGCLVVEMFTGNHPFPEFSQMQAIFRLGNSVSPAIPDECPADAKSFLTETFQIDFNKRPTASELLGHEFIKGAKKSSKQ